MSSALRQRLVNTYKNDEDDILTIDGSRPNATSHYESHDPLTETSKAKSAELTLRESAAVLSVARHEVDLNSHEAVSA